MMDCTQAGDLIEEFREGTLDAAGDEALRDHLGACKACRRRLSGLNAVDRLMRMAAGGHEGPPADFAGRVMARVMAAEPPRAGGSRRFSPAHRKAILAAAAMVLAAFTFGMTLRPGGWADRLRERMASARSRIHEPEPGAPLAMGKAFAIRADGKTERVENAGRMRVTGVVRGVPVLVVEAFPEETTRGKADL